VLPSTPIVLFLTDTLDGLSTSASPPTPQPLQTLLADLSKNGAQIPLSHREGSPLLLVDTSRR
jgi:hypothetical protein